MRHRNRIVYYSGELLSFVVHAASARIEIRAPAIFDILGIVVSHRVSHGIVNSRFLMLLNDRHRVREVKRVGVGVSQSVVALFSEDCRKHQRAVLDTWTKYDSVLRYVVNCS